MGKKDNGFFIFYDWREAFTALSGDDCKSILMAMFDYAEKDKEPPEFEGLAKMAACFIFPAMKRRKESVENGRRGGQARVENAASGDGKSEGAEDYSNSTPLQPPLNPPSTPLDDMSNPPSSTKTRQDIDIDNKQDLDLDLDIDEDKTVTASSVVGLAKSICEWIDYPTVLTRELCQRIEGSGYDYEDYRRLFEVANECDFLKGKGGRGWKASLEWLIEHMYEVTSGKYRTWNKPAEPESSSFDTDEFFEAALRRSYNTDFKLNTEDNEK